MKAPVVFFAIVALTLPVLSAKYQPRKRIYSNDLPSLQIVGVAMSENLDIALETVEKRGKQEAGLQLSFPVMVDEPSALVTGEGSADAQMHGNVKDAWDMISSGQFNYQSNVARMYRLNRYGPVSLILLDRQRRIRAIAVSQALVQNASSSRFAELIEYLLLNVGGVEAIPYNVAEMSNTELAQALDLSNPSGLYSWEHAAELQKRETQAGKSGAQLTAVYPLFGQQAPDFELMLLNGTGTTSFSKLAQDKVTLLVLFWAGGESSNLASVSQGTAAMEQLKAVDRMHIDWTLKLAEPGAQQYANVQPMAGTSTDLAKASTRGEFRSSAKPAESDPALLDTTSVSAAEFGREEREEKESKRFGVSIGLGFRHFTSPTKEFQDQDLSQFSGAFGVKLSARVWRFVGLEASVQPSIYGKSWKEENKNVVQEILVPLSINLMIMPTVGNGFFTPIIHLGIGPSLASFKKREENPDAVPDFLTINNPATNELYFPDGLGFHRNAGIAGEFRITEKIFAGLDLRYFFLEAAKPSVEDVEKVRDESDTYAAKDLAQKEMDYRNTTVLIYGGLKF